MVFFFQKFNYFTSLWNSDWNLKDKMSENTENGGGSLKQVAHPLKDSWILFADQNGTKKKDTSGL